MNENANSLHEDIGSTADAVMARSALYAEVANAFLDPNPELAQRLADGSLRAELGDLLDQIPMAASLRASTYLALDSLATLSREVEASNLDAALHGLKVEFARLFLGPGRPAVSPYETLYGRRNKDTVATLMVSREAEGVSKSYREAGVGLSASQHEPPDHFATECEFMCFLCAQEAESAAQQDVARASEWRRRQVTFLEEHLGRWQGPFLAAVENDARDEFYRVVARLAAAFLSADLAAAGLESLVSAPA